MLFTINKKGKSKIILLIRNCSSLNNFKNYIFTVKFG